MNMSYCRFQNTLNDMYDCYDNFDETSDMSNDEQIARKKMIELCADIIDEFGIEINYKPD